MHTHDHEQLIPTAQLLGREIARSDWFHCKNESQGTVLAFACLIRRKCPFEVGRQLQLVKDSRCLAASTQCDPYIDPENGLLDEGTIAQLVESIGPENVDAMRDHLVTRNWLRKGETISHLTPTDAKQILADPEKFLSRLKGTQRRN